MKVLKSLKAAVNKVWQELKKPSETYQETLKNLDV